MFAAHQKATSQEERAWVEAETIGQVQANDREGSCSAEGAQCEGRAGAAGANAPGPGEDTAVSWQVEAELDCMPKRQWCMLAPIGTRMPRVNARRAFIKGGPLMTRALCKASTATQYCLAMEALHSDLVIKGPLHKRAPRVLRAACVYLWK